MELLGLIDVPTWLQWLMFTVGLLVTYVVYMSWNHNTFKNMGIAGPTPDLVLGNMRMVMKDGLVQTERKMCCKYGKVFGMYESYIPVLYIADPKLLKEIMVKEFKSFANRRNTFTKFSDRKMSKMLVQLEDDHWRFVRNVITPTFSGKKLRQMTSLINSSADIFMENLEQQIKQDNDIDIKKFIGGFTMDAIASTAFGLDVNSQNNPDDPFTKHIRTFTYSNALIFLMMIVFFLPFLGWVLKLCEFLGINLTEAKAATTFFTRVTEKALEERRKSPGQHSDFLATLINAEDKDEKSSQMAEDAVHKEQDISQTSSTWTRKTLTSDEIMAQATMFFIAGYDTTSNTLCFIMYHLAIYPDICDKVLQEIDEKLCGVEPNYDNVANLSYMEMFVHETMRLFPAAARIDRMASNDVTIGDIRIPKGMIVNIPVGAIHMDPKYWPEPETFDPERFTPEAKANRDPFVFMPFGAGPRNCVGMRLALLEIKILLARILQKYRPVTGPKTKVPIQISKLGNIPLDLFLKFGRRN